MVLCGWSHLYVRWVEFNSVFSAFDDFCVVGLVFSQIVGGNLICMELSQSL